MPRNPRIIEQMRERQAAMFRIALDPTRYGLTLKRIHIDTDIGYDSLRDYASGKTIMPITALDSLIGVIPDELLSLLLPAGRVILLVPEDIDHDEMAEAMQDYLIEKARAHHPESPAGREIAPCEDEALRGKIVKLAKVA